MSLLQVDDLQVWIGPRGRETRILRGVSMAIEPGQTLGLIGESGSGKSMTALAIAGLLPAASRISGSIRFRGTDLPVAGEEVWRQQRGRHLSMIFQEPMTALNPVLSVGFQLAEMLRIHEGLPQAMAHEGAVDLLHKVGIAEPQRRARAYPHEMSGGMRQRVMIAMAMACKPALLIADEPTTALDVSVQAQILDLILQMQQESSTAVLFISHNFGVISEMTDRVMVMYAGRVVEEGPTTDVLASPVHPYTAALMRTVPDLRRRVDRLPVIDGTVPHPSNLPAGCAFHDRCPQRAAACAQKDPMLTPLTAARSGADRRAACIHA